MTDKQKLFLGALHIVHQRRIKADVIAYIGLEKKEDKEHSNHLSMWVFDETSGAVMTLRLSAFRKLIKFVDACDLREARRLTFFEKLFMKKATRNRNDSVGLPT